MLSRSALKTTTRRLVANRSMDAIQARAAPRFLVRARFWLTRFCLLTRTWWLVSLIPAKERACAALAPAKRAVAGSTDAPGAAGYRRASRWGPDGWRLPALTYQRNLQQHACHSSTRAPSARPANATMPQLSRYLRARGACRYHALVCDSEGREGRWAFLPGGRCRGNLPSTLATRYRHNMTR